MGIRTAFACQMGSLAHVSATKLLHKGGGSIPGVVAGKIDPQIIGNLADKLEGAVMVTGTNGKTTTTGIIADALSTSQHAAICNRAGNNMTSGTATSLVLGRRHLAGAFAAFETDELYTVRLTPQVKPKVLVLLNLFRDQLDRYGSQERIQDAIAESLRRSPVTTFIYNADDPLSSAIADAVDNPCLGFGIDEPTDVEADDSSASRVCACCGGQLDYDYVQYGHLGAYRCPSCGWKRPHLAFAVRNVRLGEDGYEFDVVDQRGGDARAYHLTCKYNGLYTVYNIAAAFAATLVMGGDVDAFQGKLDAYVPTGARGKSYVFGDVEVFANLAKNPIGFDRMIQQIRAGNGRAMAFFLNDYVGDGYDISWIWDVHFERLLPQLKAAAAEGGYTRVFVGGTRKEELLMRLAYAGIAAERVESAEEVLTAVAGDLNAGRIPQGAPASGAPCIKLYMIANYTSLPEVASDLDRLVAAGWTAGQAGVSSAAHPLALPQPPVVPDPAFALDRPLRIMHLYPDTLNLYGDAGNIASLERRCAWRGIPVEVVPVMQSQEPVFSRADIVVLGGGTDRDQEEAAGKLAPYRDQLATYLEDGGMMLALCGGYHMLGSWFEAGAECRRVPGLGILDLTTKLAPERLTGNVAVDCAITSTSLVGFENHAGMAVLGALERPLGRMIAGTGNNGEDSTEGVLHGGLVATNLVGPVLPKNPELADWLIAGALKRRGVTAPLPTLANTAEDLAHEVALAKTRA